MPAAMPADGPITADRPGRVAAADPPPAPLPSFAGSVARARRRVASAETERLYTADWTAFETWCARAGRICLPADAATVADFLTEAAATVSAGALGRRAAAIAARHRAGVHPVPTTDPAVRAVLRGARREATPRRPKPKTEAALTRMAGRCPGDLAGLRDRALLLLAAHGLGRAALVGLDVEHIRFTTTAAEFVPNVSATTPAGVSPMVIGRGANRSLCPVQALEDWLATSDTRYGPVFHKIDRGGGIAHHRLGTDAIRRILARRERHRGARPRRKPRPRAQPDGGA